MLLVMVLVLVVVVCMIVGIVMWLVMDVWDGGEGDGIVIVAGGGEMVVMVRTQLSHQIPVGNRSHGDSVGRISLTCDWEFS